MSIKSLVTKSIIDHAQRSHLCQANKKHQIKMGDVRLKVKNGRGWDHYCAKCAEAILKRDIEKLVALQELRPEISEK